MSRIEEIKSMSDAEIKQKLVGIKRTFVGIPILKGKEDYPYSLFSLTDFTPAMTPDLVEDMADLLVYYGDFQNADIIVSEADRGGGPLAHAVAVRTGLPYTLANWYPKETVGQISVAAKIGFSGQGYIYLNGIMAEQRAILVDDLLSTGGTAVALLQAIKKAKAISIQALFVAEKLGLGGSSEIEKQCKVPVVTLVKFKAEGETTTDPEINS
jgi:adenine phosphoribosyltransferase